MSNSSQKHPTGLYVLFVTEMWERFSYYGMLAIFTLYMTKALLFDKSLASNIYGNYTGLVYLTPLIGGYVADKYWGNRRSILAGGILMAIGQFLLFFSGTLYSNPTAASPFFYGGLFMLIMGNGFFKPNISSMVGQLYPEGDRRLDSAFTIFYMGINLGAFFSPLICGTLGDTGNPADFKWGFFAAGSGMVLSIIFFELMKKKYIVTPTGAPVGMPPAYYHKNRPEGDSGTATNKPLTKEEKDRIAVIFIISVFVIFFWAAFEQAGASLTFFAEEQTDRNFLGKIIPASYFQSINPLAIILLATPLAALWTGLGNKGREPSSPMKQALGLFLLSIGYLVIAFGVKGIEPGVKVSMMWLIGMYLIHTVGELCLSPIGLSMVVKLSPRQFTSILMAVWFLSTAAANKFAGVLSGLYPEPMVPVELVHQLETEHQTTLMAKAAKPELVNSVEVVSLESVNFSEVKDKAERESMVQLVATQQVVKAKSFLGFTIDSLYSFFMIFVFMAGIASLLLFFFSRKLLKMMHGIQ